MHNEIIIIIIIIVTVTEKLVFSIYKYKQSITLNKERKSWY
jgi:hypothetical protein